MRSAPENFIAKRKRCEKWYPEKDYHTVYIAEITKVLVERNNPCVSSQTCVRLGS